MSEGVVVEYVPPFKLAPNSRFDTPFSLYDNEKSVFFSLCEKSGINREDIINASQEPELEKGNITLPHEATADEMREIFTPWIRAWMSL